MPVLHLTVLAAPVAQRESLAALTQSIPSLLHEFLTVGAWERPCLCLYLSSAAAVVLALIYCHRHSLCAVSLCRWQLFLSLVCEQLAKLHVVVLGGQWCEHSVLCCSALPVINKMHIHVVITEVL